MQPGLLNPFPPPVSFDLRRLRNLFAPFFLHCVLTFFSGAVFFFPRGPHHVLPMLSVFCSSRACPRLVPALSINWLPPPRSVFAPLQPCPVVGLVLFPFLFVHCVSLSAIYHFQCVPLFAFLRRVLRLRMSCSVRHFARKSLPVVEPLTTSPTRVCLRVLFPAPVSAPDCPVGVTSPFPCRIGARRPVPYLFFPFRFFRPSE